MRLQIPSFRPKNSLPKAQQDCRVITYRNRQIPMFLVPWEQQVQLRRVTILNLRRPKAWPETLAAKCIKNTRDARHLSQSATFIPFSYRDASH